MDFRLHTKTPRFDIFNELEYISATKIEKNVNSYSDAFAAFAFADAKAPYQGI